MPAPSPETVATVLRHVDASLEASRGRLFDLLRIPSISAQPAHKADCVRAAEWVRDQLSALGFRADVRPTAGHPVVVAHHAGPAGYQGPHVLFYSHYDVQPVDPLELWTSPPFDPQLVDGPRDEAPAARAIDELQALRRARCGGRQGSVDDVHRGPARLEGHRRQHPRPYHHAGGR